LIECEASFNGKKEKMVIFMTFKLVPDLLQPPDLFKYESSPYAVIGGPVTLVCKINVDFNTAHTSFEWEYPDVAHAREVAELWFLVLP
jgi:hypothetical protein